MRAPAAPRAPTATAREDAIANPSCPACGRSAAADDRFCGRCGTALTLLCSHCGRTHTNDLSYCTGCGHPLLEQNSASPKGAREERRRVSVLFIDAIGSTPFAQQADPETVRAAQSEFFATVREVVRRYGGVVEKYIGDAAMALFGAPVATGTDALRCVRAGLALQHALGGGAAAAWTFRVGIATGEAVVDMAAAHDAGQAIVAGDVVNTAARLQAQAPAGAVLVCGATYAATRSDIEFGSSEAVTLRGRSGVTEVWVALGPADSSMDQSSLEGAMGVDPVAMVGRDHELGLLTSALQHVISESSPRLVGVLGVAGIGKSRLVRELFGYAQQQAPVPVRWLSGRCQPFGENVGYSALADMVKSQAGVLATDSPLVARERLDEALARLVPAAESARLSDALRPLLGLPGSPLSTEEAEAAWRSFLYAVAATGTTVLVFEDLHWADDTMIHFVELLATVREIPLLVVATARPDLVERVPGWAGSVPGMLTIGLTPLRDESIATLYSHIFGQASLPPQLLRSLVELADGMPLYAQEYARMLIERGTLRQSEHAWVLPADGELPMPEGVHAVIANRIDLLDAPERSVLQAAAVVGARFWPGAVAAALGAHVDTVERALRRLAARDLVRDQPASTMANETEYRFRHVLVSEVCYERLPRAERIARHVRVADWLSAKVDGRGGDLAEVVAHHRYTAFVTARALGHDPRPYAVAALAALRQAARRAAMLAAYDSAAAHVARATELVNDGAAEADRLAVELLGAELALHQDQKAFLAGPGPQRLHELTSLLYQAADPGGAARAWTLLGEVAWLQADRVEALRCLDHAVELFDECPDTAEKAQAYAELGRLHMLNYEHSPALGAAQIANEIAERLGLVELQAGTLITMGMCRYQAGDPDALADLAQALEFCRLQQLPSLSRAVQAIADALREEGEHEQCERVLASAQSALAAPAGVDTSVAVGALVAGEWDNFLTAVESILDAPVGEWDIRLQGVRAWVRALRGDDAGAAQDTAAALATARTSGLRRLQWSALANGALCQTVLGRTEDAELLLRELGEGWRKMRTIPSADWVGAAAHAAVQLGPQAAEMLRDVLCDAPHQTAWSRAALASMDGAMAAGRGEHAQAAARHLDAAQRYADAGAITDRTFALAAAVRELSLAGDPRATVVNQEVADFAARNHLVALLPA